MNYGLNKLYTASTGYTGNHKPSGHSSALAVLGTLQPGPRVRYFPYIPRTQCITGILYHRYYRPVTGYGSIVSMIISTIECCALWASGSEPKRMGMRSIATYILSPSFKKTQLYNIP